MFDQKQLTPTANFFECSLDWNISATTKCVGDQRIYCWAKICYDCRYVDGCRVYFWPWNILSAAEKSDFRGIYCWQQHAAYIVVTWPKGQRPAQKSNTSTAEHLFTIIMTMMMSYWWRRQQGGLRNWLGGVRTSKNSVIVRQSPLSRRAANTNSGKSVKSVHDNWANRK